MKSALAAAEMLLAEARLLLEDFEAEPWHSGLVAWYEAYGDLVPNYPLPDHMIQHALR